MIHFKTIVNVSYLTLDTNSVIFLFHAVARWQHLTRAMDSSARSARAERAPAAERRLTVWPVRLGNESFLRKKVQFFGALRAQRLHGMGRRSAAEKLHG